MNRPANTRVPAASGPESAFDRDSMRMPHGFSAETPISGRWVSSTDASCAQRIARPEGEKLG
jgi:hypothetical protein